MAQKQPKNFVKESGNKTRLKAGRKDAFGKNTFTSQFKGIFGHRYGLKTGTESFVKENQEVWVYMSRF